MYHYFYHKYYEEIIFIISFIGRLCGGEGAGYDGGDQRTGIGYGREYCRGDDCGAACAIGVDVCDYQ
jgi:hypothetical protein